MTTPLIEITKLGFRNGNRVFAKCENRSPLSYSHYDRVYRRLFDRCMADGTISRSKGTHLFETSSGNAGTAFARFCDLYGFRGTIIFPKDVRQTRLDTINSPNVSVVVSENDGYMEGARQTLITLVRNARDAGDQVYIMNHSQTWESVIAMEECGDEINASFDALRMSPDIFISALGNGTSTSGIGLSLKAEKPHIKIIGFEPISAAVYSSKFRKQAAAPHFAVSPLTGTGVWGIKFPNFDARLLDDILVIEDNDRSIDRWHSLMAEVREKFGESIGYTSAAAIGVAQDIAGQVQEKIILTIFYDVQEYYSA